MYIQKVKLQNFRSFGDEGICFLFNKGINAVIGENNNGKTALMVHKQPKQGTACPPAACSSSPCRMPTSKRRTA